jgi:peptide/nickel transport system substrate-binding protein
MKRIPIISLAAMLVLASCGGAPTETPGASGGSPVDEDLAIVVPVKAEAKSLNPDWQNDNGGYWANGNIYSRLVILDWGAVTGTVAYGDLAESWEGNEDGTSYTFHLREGVTWHDGEPFTSADVVYTYQTIVEKEYPLAQYLAGADITAPDDLTVQIDFAEPNVAFVPLLAQASNWYGAILPKHIYEDTDWSANPANEEPIGTGPFKFASWDKGTQITLEGNPDYFLGAPELDRLTFQVVADAQVAQAGFDAGEFPYLTNDYVTNFPQLAALAQAGDDPIVVQTPSLFDRSLMFNLSNEYLATPLVRQAIAYGVDREAMNQTAFAGLWEPTYNAGISSVSAFLNGDAQFPHHDAERAKELLDEAGYPEGADGTRFALSVTNYPVADSNLIAEVVVQQLKEIGIDATWDQYDLPTWLDKLNAGEFDITSYFVRYGPDPAAYGEHFGLDAPRNFMGYQNDTVDELLGEGRATTDVATRKDIYGQVQEQLVKDIPYVPLFTEHKFSLVHAGWTGFAVMEDGYNKSIGWFGFYAVHKTN